MHARTHACMRTYIHDIHTYIPFHSIPLHYITLQYIIFNNNNIYILYILYIVYPLYIYMHVESQISRLKMSDDVPFLSTLGRNHDLGEFPMWRRFLQKIVSTTSKLNSEPWNNSSETPEPSWAAWSSLWARGTKAWHENLGWCFAPKILQIQRHEPASDRLHCRSIIFAKIFAEDFKLLGTTP